MANRVQITLDEDDYAALKALADDEDRGVAQQARHMLRRALKNSRGEARAHEINAALLKALQDPQSPDPGPDRGLQGEHQPETHDVTEGAGPAQLGGFKHTDEAKTPRTSKE